MPARIRVPHRVIQHIAIPVQRLRIPRLRHNRVRLHEAPQGRIVPSRVVRVQANGSLFPLPGKAIRRGRRAPRVARLAPGFVPELRLLAPCRVGRDSGRVQGDR
jgi:hypothetical protein